MDTDVVVAAQRGDHDAFARLATASARRMNALAMGILRDPTLAEDAVQQALISIWKDLPALRDPTRFEAWSYRLLVRACYAESKRSRKKAPPIGPDYGADSVTPDASRHVADRDRLERAFERLSLDQRAVVVLHYYMDLPQEGVARTLGIRPGTVRSRLHRAMQTLRSALEADERPAMMVALDADARSQQGSGR